MHRWLAGCPSNQERFGFLHMKRATYYNILGLDPRASKEAIRSSFRQLALRYHPDRNAAEKNAHTVFIAIHNAYQVLINERTRRDYDAYLASIAPRRVAGRRHSSRQHPRVHETVSVFNSALWGLEDLLKGIDNENMAHRVGKITIYEYVLKLLGYLENEILNESSRFSSFAGKRSKAKLHLDNYFFLLRVEIEKHLRELETGDCSSGLRRIVAVEAELVKSMEEIRKCI